MSKQTPRGSADMNCPLHKLPMEDVCHKCPWWLHVPNVGTDDWQCAITWLPMIGFQQSQVAFAVSKEINELRNETKKHQDESIAMSAVVVQRARDAVRDAALEVSARHDPKYLISSGGDQ